MLGVSDRAKLPHVSRYRRAGCSLPLPTTASAPRSLRAFSRLNTQPKRTPVNASPWPLRTTTHDSGPEWIATPSPYGSFIHNTSPVLTAHCRLLKKIQRQGTRKIDELRRTYSTLQRGDLSVTKHMGLFHQ